MTQARLTGSDLYDWIALRRVSSGGIAMKAQRWFDAGRRVPDYVADALAGLRDAELITVADPDVSSIARVVITDAGIARYDVLCQQRRQAVPVIEPGASGPSVDLPAPLVHPAAGHHLELSAALALQRVHRGEIAKLGDRYLDCRWLTLLYLASAPFEELVDAGLLALTAPDSHGLRQVILTDAGCTQHAQLQGTSPRPELRVPDPPFLTESASSGDQSGLPVRLPGTHLYPQLRRTPVADRGDAEGSSG